ncbi:CCAAT/enhancer-binding protein gamma [Folsomia candida]|uniref:CCAAT/enhancer-binding protein gamma n=1 Tax=Folsomia candida TaxID=158441 RepID=UPI000B9057AE|nr:CCAAT/enhancer-binding protein gamma [Folsomia candida]
MGSKKKGSSGPEKHSMEYKEKRMKNNVAVKRSRDKSKMKAREAQSRVQQLQAQNEHLHNTVDSMTSELRYLKDLLISQAGTSEYLSPDTAADLEDLLMDDAPRDLGKLTSVLNEVKRIQAIQKNGMESIGSHQQQNHLYAAGNASSSGYSQMHMYNAGADVFDASNPYL